MPSLAERFERCCSPEPTSGCWLWTGATSKAGYGQISVVGRIRYAHRVALELGGKTIPSGLMALHRCDNKACVNPAHLYIGTAKQNTRDAYARGLLRRGPRAKPVRASWAKLTRQTAEQAFERWRFGETQTSIAKSLGVSQSCISSLVRGESWRHIHG